MKAVALTGLLLLLAVSCSKKEAGSPRAANTPSAGGEKKSYLIRANVYVQESQFKDPEQVANIAAGAFRKLVDVAQAESDGRIKFKFFWGYQLGSGADQNMGSIKNGAFELADEAVGNWGGLTDAFMPMNIPFLLSGFDNAEKFMASDVPKKMKAKALEDTGMRILGFQVVGFRHITNNKRPVRTPDDMRGLKIRTMTDPYQMEAMRLLGAAPTPIAWAELFTAMQQGVVDAEENPILNIQNSRFYEVQKYLTLTGHNFTLSTYYVGDKYFQSLPPDIQQVLLHAGAEAESYSLDLLRRKEPDMIAYLKSQTSMEVYQPTQEELSQFRKKMAPLWGKIREKLGDDYYREVLQAAGLDPADYM